MKTSLVSITKPVRNDLVQMTPEQFLAYQARVSNPSNQYNNASSERLLEYCLTKGHWSVFEMVDVTFEIETSRAIMAQVLRHWSFRFQEFSQRYAKAGKVEPIEIRRVHKDGNRQGSSDEDPFLSELAKGAGQESFDSYDDLLDAGAAPESARFILPLATTTNAYMKGNVRSWVTYFWQRRDHHAQKEHRELANLIFDQFATYFPLVSKLIDEGKFVYTKHEQ